MTDLSETLARVLSEPRFDAPVETWWDRFLQRLFAEAIRLLGTLIEAVGGPGTAAVIALAIVATVTFIVVSRLAGRRAAVVDHRLELSRLLEYGADPATYLAEAQVASRRGEHASAIRLRFVGGVLEMGRQGRIRYEPGLTTEGITAQVDLPAFETLAQQFDAIAYGGVSADAMDDQRSQEVWATLRVRA
jgi:hypothetical protein